MTDPVRSIVAWPRFAWWLLFAVIAGYVAWRMGGFVTEAVVATSDGLVSVPTTFASVDHPFHVARAATLWRQLEAGHLLRWVGQHQGGYPVEFYPLGEAWLEVGVRAMALGTISAEAAHTIAVIVIFLAPGAAFAALANEDGWSPAVALLALALHVSLPGSWYDGGYTELVQWGLVTNVAGAVAAFLMLPLLIRFLSSGAGWAGASAALMGTAAIYCNPRSLIGLVAVGGGAWLASSLSGRHGRWTPTARLGVVAAAVVLLTAPELIALIRFRGLYDFVQYSGYETVAGYASTSAAAVTWPVIALAVGGGALAVVTRGRLALRSTAIALLIYVVLTLVVAFAPIAGRMVSQLEPTRLMPLQRLMTIYLASSAMWALVAWLGGRVTPRLGWVPSAVVTGLAAGILLVLTRPLTGPPPDPASPVVPAVSLYPVAHSGQVVQADLAAAVQAADDAARPGTALLVLGSALSWHQQLWAPLWTSRPLFSDNWLWYWHPWHAGTPGYRAEAGHHYPDPEQTLDRAYLQRHGIGAVVVTGDVRDVAVRSPLLRQLRTGAYDAYTVRDPTTVITFGGANAAPIAIRNQRLEGVATTPGSPVLARQNWHPRWDATVDGVPANPERRGDGYLGVAPREPASLVELRYTVQGLDWAARGLAGLGIATLILMATGGRLTGIKRWRWYLQSSSGNGT